MLRSFIPTVMLALMAMTPLRAETFLYMAEEHGCYWCERWNAEISAIYPKTAEGRTAPLRRFEVSAPPDGVTFKSSPHYTPTFILVTDGVEVARLEGYPGEDFFWALLEEMFQKSKTEIKPAG